MKLMTTKTTKDLFNVFNNIFDMFDDTNQIKKKPAVDIIEKDTFYLIKVELPGMSEKDISLEIDGEYLILKGEKSYEDENEFYHKKESYYGKFERKLYLGEECKKEDISSAYKNGVLRINIPKIKKEENIFKIPIKFE